MAGNDALAGSQLLEPIRHALHDPNFLPVEDFRTGSPRGTPTWHDLRGIPEWYDFLFSLLILLIGGMSCDVPYNLRGATRDRVHLVSIMSLPQQSLLKTQ